MSAGPEPLASREVDARTAQPNRSVCPACGRSTRPKRAKEETTDEEYRSSMLRLVNNYTKRIRSGGTQALADAVALRQALDAVIDAGVETCRTEAWSASWTEVGEATGTTRQAAQHRWASLGGARKPGGQPGELR